MVDSSTSSDEQAIREAFDMFDKDGSGDIDVKEFQALAYMSGRVLSDAQAEAMVAELDTDKSGKIEFNEFLAWFSGKGDGSAGETADEAFESASAELRVLRGRLMADYGLKMAEYYVDQIDAPTSAEAEAAAGSKPLGLKLELVAGEHAIKGDDGNAQLHLTIRDSATSDATREAVGSIVDGAIPDGALAITFDFAVKADADASDIAAKLGEMLKMAPPGKIHAAEASVVDSDSGECVRITAAIANPKSEKVAGMIAMANIQNLSLDVNMWPQPSRSKAESKDLAFGLSFNASVPSMMLDLFSAKVKSGGSKGKPFVKLLTALRMATLRFQYDSFAEIAEVIPKGLGQKFIEEGNSKASHLFFFFPLFFPDTLLYHLPLLRCCSALSCFL
jgi:EF-hand domain pair